LGADLSSRISPSTRGRASIKKALTFTDGTAILFKMNKKQPIQFKTIKEIEAFLKKKDTGMLDNLWENITDEFDYYDEPEVCVAEFNRSIKRLKKLVS
jgi:hypothetical protein